MRGKWIGVILGVGAGVAAWVLSVGCTNPAYAQEIEGAIQENVPALESYYAHEVGESGLEPAEREAIDREEWFVAPNLRRVEQSKPFKMTSVCDGVSLHTYYPDYGLLLVSEPRRILDNSLLELDRFARARSLQEYLAHEEKEATAEVEGGPDHLLARAREFARRLSTEASIEGNEDLQGNQCVVIRQAQTLYGKSMGMRTWVDEKLLLPRRMQFELDGRVGWWLELKALRLNEYIPAEMFQLLVEKPHRTVTGNFSPSSVGEQWPDITKPASELGKWGELFPGRPTWVEGQSSLEVDFTVLRPTYQPKGAKWLRDSWPREVADRQAGVWWTGAVVSDSGATLRMVEQRAQGPLPEGQLQQAGEYPGVLVESAPPLDFLTLVWDQEETRVTLEGGGFPLQELLKVATSVSAKEPGWLQEPEYQDLSVEEAQRGSDFVIYLPTHLPEGIGEPQVSFCPATDMRDGRHFPPQMNVTYESEQSYLLLWEIRGEGEITPRGEEETVQIDGVTALYDEDDNGLRFMLGNTEVGLDGSVSKEELIRIARSVKPAAPQIAREKGLLKED